MPYDAEKASDVKEVAEKLKKTYKNVSDTAARQAIHVLNSVMESTGDEGKAWASVYSQMNERGLSKKESSDKSAERVLTASDRSALIRLASELPKGSKERKAILAGLFGSKHRIGKLSSAGIPVTLKKDLKFKDGSEIRKGEKGTLRFNEGNPGLATVDFESRKGTRLSSSKLSDYFGRPFTKEPSMASLERMSDGIAKSVTGKTVEPDGYGPDGSPSWLLVLGFI